MEPPRTTLPHARAMRVIHLALTLGLTLCGAVFFLVHRVQEVPAVVPASIGTALTVAAIGAIVVAVTVMRPRVPPQAPDQTPDMYWGDGTVRMTALVLWAAVESGGLLAAVGYLLTGATAPAIAFVIAVATLATLGPRRFEQGDS